MGLYIGFCFGIVFPVFFCLYIAGLRLTAGYISTAIVTVIFTVKFYQQIKKNHLKPHKNTEHTPLAKPPA
jgi:hypothetical protein